MFGAGLMGWVYSAFRLLFGTLYPAYASYKAVRTKNVKEYVSISDMIMWNTSVYGSGIVAILEIFITNDFGSLPKQHHYFVYVREVWRFFYMVNNQVPRQRFNTLFNLL